MSAADSKPVKIHEFVANSFTEPGEHILCAVILGPDRDDSTRHTLHLRANASAIELLRAMPPETRRMIVEHQERLLPEFRNLLRVA